MKEPKEQKPDEICPDCGTYLDRDRHELVCPDDGHRFVVKDNALVVSPRKLHGPGPDGVPDRRRYPSLEGGMTRRTTEPKNQQPRSRDTASPAS